MFPTSVSVPDMEIVSHQTSGFEWMQIRSVSWVGMPDEKAGHDLEIMLESGNSVPWAARGGRGRAQASSAHPTPTPALPVIKRTRAWSI